MDLVSTSAAGIAVVLTTWQFRNVFKNRIGVGALSREIERLLSLGQVARAIKLCSAADSAYPRMLKKTLLRITRATSLEGLLTLFEESRSEELRSVAQGGWLTLLGAAFAACSLVLGATAQPVAPVPVLIGLACLSTMWWCRKRTRHLVAASASEGRAIIEMAHELAKANAHLNSVGDWTGPQSTAERSSKGPASLDWRNRTPDNQEAPSEFVYDAKPSNSDSVNEALQDFAVVSGNIIPDMREGRCAVCGSMAIESLPDPARPAFTMHSCNDCGYTQFFAMTTPPRL
ncbi:MAG: hypothetical protein GY813_20240 [Halieaceae bacterium]|nr:hypothetical protein [Halieaceae bacterium]